MCRCSSVMLQAAACVALAMLLTTRHTPHRACCSTAPTTHSAPGACLLPSASPSVSQSVCVYSTHTLDGTHARAWIITHVWRLTACSKAVFAAASVGGRRMNGPRVCWVRHGSTTCTTLIQRCMLQRCGFDAADTLGLAPVPLQHQTQMRSPSCCTTVCTQ